MRPTIRCEEVRISRSFWSARAWIRRWRWPRARDGRNKISGHRAPRAELNGMTEDDRAIVEQQLGNRYQIIRELGAGAFGAVYLARERDLHRLVAIKVLRGDRAWSDDERERL